MNHYMNIEAFVLAGGKSSRMGQDKGLIDFIGKPMISYVLDKLSELNIPVKLITSNPDYKKFHCKVVADIIPDKGPMGGLFTALHTTVAGRILLISCDMPFITSHAIKKLLSETDKNEVIITSVQNRLNPLFAVYKQTLADIVKEKIENNHLKMLDMVHTVQHKEVSMDSLVVDNRELFANINSPSDINIYEA